MYDETTRLLAHDGEEVEVSNPPCVKKNAQAMTPLPWGPLTVLVLLNMVAPIAFELIYPFVNQVRVLSGI